MTSPTTRHPVARAAAAVSRVPEVTIYFWLIKVLCTTVGESVANHVDNSLGAGRASTTVVFAAALVVVGAVQFGVRRYVPAVYWLTVLLASVVGTLLSDDLTDDHRLPLGTCTLVFAVLLAAVFAGWFVVERTLSIHTITTTRREAFYWLTVLVTFALGTAAGDWTLELTGWSPGRSVLLPAGLLALVVAARRLGAGPVWTFWLAFVLTRPLGANLGDFLGSSSSSGGEGLGTLGTSVVFLAAILLTVVFLTASGIDRTENRKTEAR